MATSTLAIRLDSNLKDEASRIIEQYGLDISMVMCAFLMQIVNTNAIPLSFDYEQPNEESLIAVRETKEMIANGSGESYDNGRDLIQAALA